MKTRSPGFEVIGVIDSDVDFHDLFLYYDAILHIFFDMSNNTYRLKKIKLDSHKDGIYMDIAA